MRIDDGMREIERKRVRFKVVRDEDTRDNLRTDSVVLLSLVAEVHRKIVGHILFSRMSIETAEGSIPAVALAPMAVLPDHQRQRIGERLIQEGLNVLREQCERVVIVLGHPNYYPRFGFSAEKARSLASSLRGVHGKVKYPAAFGL